MNRKEREKIFARDSGFISGCLAQSNTTFLDSEKPVDSFCAGGNGRGLIEPGLISGLARPIAGLEQFQNTSPWWRRVQNPSR